METIPVQTAGSRPTQLVYAGEGQILLFNNDIVNTVVLSDVVGINVGQASTVVPLGPLESLVVNGHKDIFAAPLLPNATVQVCKIPGGMYLGPSPSQSAASIQALGLATTTDVTVTLPNNQGATTGSPGIGINHGTKNLFTAGFGAPITIAPGASVTVSGANLTISRPGYIIRCQPWIIGAEASPLLGFSLQWFDSVISAQIHEEDWYTPLPGSASGAMKIFGKGPTKGNALKLVLTNYSATQTANVVLSFDETSHHISRDDWRSNMPVNTATSVAPGFSIPSGNPFALLQCVANGTAIAANTLTWYLLPLYAGQLNITVSQSVAQAMQIQVVVWDPTINLIPFTSPNLLTVTTAAAKQAGPYTVFTPRAPTLLGILTGGAVENYQVVANGIEYTS